MSTDSFTQYYNTEFNNFRKQIVYVIKVNTKCIDQFLLERNLFTEG